MPTTEQNMQCLRQKSEISYKMMKAVWIQTRDSDCSVLSLRCETDATETLG